jgi:hypothetical protein
MPFHSFKEKSYFDVYEKNKGVFGERKRGLHLYLKT